MLLAIDVGNTNTVFGVSDFRLPPDTLVHSWRLSSARDRMPDEWFALLSPLLACASLVPSQFTGMIVSSVVPAVTTSLLELGRRYLALDPVVVNHTLDLGISIKVDNPAEVGTDRLVNAAFAYRLFGGPTIVVDLGTATKLEAISASGEYLGGVIAPGIGLTLDALASRAARLYSVELKVLPTAIGRNTVAAVQSGVVSGHVAMIDGMVARIREELGGAKHVLLTGGFSETVHGSIRSITEYSPNLTLLGLRYLYDRNHTTTQGTVLAR